MPAQRPRAAFQPISAELNIRELVESNQNFRYVDRIAVDQLQEHGLAKFEKLVLMHVILGGKPLVIDGFDNLLDPWTFTPKWLRDNVGDKVEQARDLEKKQPMPLTIAHYLKNMGAVANQHYKHNEPGKTRSVQRIYLKDIDCPQVWHDKLKEHIPPFLYYMNDSTGEVGGPGAGVDATSSVPGRRVGRGIARAGDLMSSLPPDMRADNMMCYVGHEGTYTPSHREMCATMGHNIMVEASGDLSEDGKPERPGSSIWFMTEAKDRHTVSEYWLSVLGHDIEVENHFAQINSWKRAPFEVYVVEQKPGDFILIPPLAPHQVWNRGTRTMKVAWNRTTAETLEMAMNEALPKARIVCRDEQYKNKAIIYFTLNKYSDLLAAAKSQADRLPSEAGLLQRSKIKQLRQDFRKLFDLFSKTLLSEMTSPDGQLDRERMEYLPFDSNVTCAYCRGNIFNRFLSCPNCKDALGHSDDEPYDVCMECYAMGRSCYCISGLKWVEQFKWKELTGKYDLWRRQLVELEGGATDSIPTLAERRQKSDKKTLAEVCKEQLKRRPFKDHSKAATSDKEEESEEEIIVDDEGRVKKAQKKRSQAWLKNNSICHVCRYRQPNWRMARCTRCDRWWCYGSIFRGQDDMPLTIMENPDWECMHCKEQCFAGNCRKDPRQQPYQPKGTLLGHDTKKFADVRSVEKLVDFGLSNLNWLRENNTTDETPQMRNAQEAAQRAKDITYEMEDDEDDEHGGLVDTVADDTPRVPQPPSVDPQDDVIDPSLREETDLARSLLRFNTGEAPSVMDRRNDADHNGLESYPDGYAPATTAGFVVPTAIMRDPARDEFSYPDPTEGANDDQSPTSASALFRPFGVPHGQRNGKKRSRRSEGDQIDMEQPKRRRVTEDAATLLSGRSKNEASKQYEMQKERRALEEAKKQGRYFAVSAALRGRKRMLKLRVPGSRLAQILAREAAGHLGNGSPLQANDPATVEEVDSPGLLQSNVAEPKSHASKASADPSKPRPRKVKDDDFSLGKDGHVRQKARNGKASNGSEHIEIPSDEEDDDGDEELSVDHDYGDDAAYSTKKSSRNADGGRRISAYLRAKHQDDEDLPDELPNDFVEGKRRARVTGRPSKPLRKSDNKAASTGLDDPAGMDGTGDARPGADAKSKAAARAEASRKQALEEEHRRAKEAMEEENRQAKLQALNSVTIDSDSDDDEDDDSDSSVPARAPVAKMVPIVKATQHRSIFDKQSMGRKVKIVSAASAKRA